MKSIADVMVAFTSAGKTTFAAYIKKALAKSTFIAAYLFLNEKCIIAHRFLINGVCIAAPHLFFIE
jgi:hypothetical protein